MRELDLREAIDEAKRFLKRAEEALAEEERSGLKRSTPFFWSPSKHSSAVKRASMDLTRALTRLRNPN